MLAKSISEAMNNTWLGLAIAACCMIGHVFLQAASKSKQQELESFALRLENLLTDVLRDPPAPAGRGGGGGGADDYEDDDRGGEEAEPPRREERRAPRSGDVHGGGMHNARTGRPGRTRPRDEEE